MKLKFEFHYWLHDLPVVNQNTKEYVRESMTVPLQLWLFVESILRMLSTDFSLISMTKSQAILTVES